MAEQSLPVDLVSRVDAGDVVFFLGAGCSVEAPADLPSAQELADDLIARGFGNPGDTFEAVAEECQNRGVNVLSEAIPKADWRVRPCNPSHRVIARLAKEGLVSEVLTTNWDTLVEHAFQSGGVPFTPVVSPQLLREGGLAGGVRVAKIHGCIDHPEHPLRATVAELAEWSAEWARVLFEYLATMKTFVFVGYSGASAVVTVTVRSLVESQGKQPIDYLVDRRTYDEIAASELGSAFLDALGIEPERCLAMTATSFFAELHETLLGQLLARPWGLVAPRIRRLCEPTGVEQRDVMERAQRVRELWAQMGVEPFQVELQSLLVGMLERDTDHPYMPIIPHSEPLANAMAVIAILLWAEAVRITDSRTFVSPKGAVVAVFHAGPQRRDAAAILGASLFARSHGLEGGRMIGVVFGEMGPMPTDQTLDVSVARPDASSTVVRPGGPSCRWIEAGEVTSQFEADSRPDAVADAVRTVVMPA